jgi:phosphoserine aminotransferase
MYFIVRVFHLLELNHKIHEEEVKAGLWEKKGTKEYKQRKKKSSEVNEKEAGYGSLFEQE